MNIKIIGIGNRHRRDDGVGPALIDLLSNKPLANVEAVSCLCEPASLISALSGVKQAVMIDASQSTGTPGQIQKVEPDQLSPSSQAAASSHGFSLGQALSIAKALGKMPEHTIVLAVEGLDFRHGEGLSPPVRKALPELLDRVCREIRAMRSNDVNAGESHDA